LAEDERVGETRWVSKNLWVVEPVETGFAAWAIKIKQAGEKLNIPGRE